MQRAQARARRFAPLRTSSVLLEDTCTLLAAFMVIKRPVRARLINPEAAGERSMVRAEEWPAACVLLSCMAKKVAYG